MQLSYIQAISTLFDMPLTRFTALKNYDFFEQQLQNLRFFVASEVPKLEEQQDFLAQFQRLKELLLQLQRHCPNVPEIGLCLKICDEHLPKQKPKRETPKIAGTQFVQNSPVLKTTPNGYNSKEQQPNIIQTTPFDQIQAVQQEKSPFSQKSSPDNFQVQRDVLAYNNVREKEILELQEKLKNAENSLQVERAKTLKMTQQNESLNENLGGSQDQVRLLHSRIAILEAQIIATKSAAQVVQSTNVENSRKVTISANYECFLLISLLFMLFGVFIGFLK
ncbi:hypothetical protein SS50377_22609 [Spironucleus salmonicida]|uniref:Uncharacterized protein n=1 Tax=Spironucleus salmonicida TaxID=348837 RepID=V6LDY1_9EUKA|nr:hypothetical protein SS50377_22609 [Spironucleus salmonicida]|eukprot:EST41901.1 Hypothetical protein SS50377_18204 [Spironucleus salmonicida]